MPKPFVPSEDLECANFVRWLDAQIGAGADITYSHLPLETWTGGGTRGAIAAQRLKRLGVHRGVPDYLLVIKGRICFIEMKKRSGLGRVSEAQRRWLEVLGWAGAQVAVCEGFTEAKIVVSNWLDAG